MCTPSKFANDAKLGGVAGPPDGHAATQRHLDRLERDLKNFNMGKCKVLHLWRKNPNHQNTLEANWLERLLAEKDPGIPVDTQLNMSQQSALAAKAANSLVGCIRKSTASRWKEVILFFHPALMRPQLESWVRLWAPRYNRDMDILE